MEDEIPSDVRCENISIVVTIQNATSSAVGVSLLSYCISIIATIANPAIREDIFADVCNFDLANLSSVHADNNSGDPLILLSNLLNSLFAW